MNDADPSGEGAPPLAGLRRFRTPPAPLTPPTSQTSPISSISQASVPRNRTGEVCEMCAVPIETGHSHVVNIETRALQCACRACYLLFTHDGAAQGKYRAVPDRYLHDPSFVMTEGLWERLQIPVKMAFFFYNSSQERFVAFYPSPAGATESLLGLEAWEELAAAHPLVLRLAPDVEALLVHGRTEGGFDCFLVPIHACYELVGHVKRHWKGFHGGAEAWSEIETFFGGLRSRSRPLAAENPP